MLSRLIPALLGCGTLTLTTAGCCLTASELKTLRRHTQQSDAARFRKVAHRLARKHRATPVDLRPKAASWHLPFGTPRLMETEQKIKRVHVAARQGRSPGILIARRGLGQWLVLVAKPLTTGVQRVRGCDCQPHGGMYRQPPAPPAFILPTADLSKVTVVSVPYHQRVISVRRSRCPGPPVP